MRPARLVLIAGTFAAGLILGQNTTVSGTQTADGTCMASSAQLRTTLYFGLARPKGSVSELAWQMFLRDEVTARFPDGLTVWNAAAPDTKWFQPSAASFMINYRVDSLDGMLAQLKANGIEPVNGPESAENGNFAW